jgi:hypothetical protein
MQPEQSTCAPGVDALPSVHEQRTSEHIQIAVSALELRISEQIQASSNTALLAHLQRLTCPHVPTNQQQSIPPDATIATEGGKAAQEPPIDMLNDGPDPHEPEFVDFATYKKNHPCRPGTPPCDIDEPRLLTQPDDTARFLNDRKSQAGYDEYLHIRCYAFFFTLGANAAIGEALDALSAGPHFQAEQAAAVALIIAGRRTHAATEEAARTRRASSASPRADKRAQIRTKCLPNLPTSVYAARALPRSPAHWTSYAKRSLIERLKSACMPPAK